MEENKLREQIIGELNKLKGIGSSTFDEKEKVADQILKLLKEEKRAWTEKVQRLRKYSNPFF